MRKIYSLLIATLAVGIAGCGSNDGATAANSTTAGTSTADAAKASTSGLVGKYKAEINIPAGKENDPAAKMAKSMAESMTLEIKPDNAFIMTMMLPLEGTYTVASDVLSLKVTKMMGMTVEEARKMAASQGKPTPEMKDMQFKIVDGGKRLEAVQNQPGQGTMVFIRQ